METSEALYWTRQQQYSIHTQDREHCCDRDAWRHLRLFFGHDNNNNKSDVHHLDASHQDLLLHTHVHKLRSLCVDGSVFVFVHGTSLIDGLSNDIDDTAQGLGAHGDLDGGLAVHHHVSTYQTFSTVHGNGPYSVLPQEHLALSQPVYNVYGYIELSLAHRYWSYSVVRPLIRELFFIIGRNCRPGSSRWASRITSSPSPQRRTEFVDRHESVVMAAVRLPAVEQVEFGDGVGDLDDMWRSRGAVTEVDVKLDVVELGDG
ncbi:MTRF1 [Cordylochernes scorpioides]|uniref:MTRF1 n=1 Tax=Cordylochernes scorpioides TaxID=51811 RepID=A0ABY6K296_9ARAC|nr:MTRF1 [Cordylochernes scorpioides]